MSGLVRISNTNAINPKHVMVVTVDSKSLKTYVVIVGGVSVESDYPFEETVALLSGKGE